MAGTVRISPDDLVDVLSKLAKDENLQVSVKQSVKGGVIAGTGATVGGLLGGPVGIAVGATIGMYIILSFQQICYSSSSYLIIKFEGTTYIAIKMTQWCSQWCILSSTKTTSGLYIYVYIEFTYFNTMIYNTMIIP